MKEIKSTEIFQVQSYDGYCLDVKLDIPDKVKSVVIFCQGSGANTYDNHRSIEDKEFNYFDLFSEELGKRDIAFCRWNTRGCCLSSESPWFVAVNQQEFETYCPSSSIEDILAVTDFVKRLSKLEKSKVIYMGISEGATLIPFAAQQRSDVKGMLLLSFSYDNLRDTLEWQLSGGSSMINLCKWFGCSAKGYVDKNDFEQDLYDVRPSVFVDVSFEDLDLDGDGKLTEQDFALSLREYKEAVFTAIQKSDDRWLQENYDVPITSKWCRAHFELPPVSEALCSLSMPIYIFQGMEDANIPFHNVEKIVQDFEEREKNNLTVFAFADHDHDLNYIQYPLYGVISEGLTKVFDTAASI